MTVPTACGATSSSAALTVRATGNRLSKRGRKTLLSLLTLGSRMNNTSLNQGDHCIVAVDQNPAMATVQLGNQVLNPSDPCARGSRRCSGPI